MVSDWVISPGHNPAATVNTRHRILDWVAADRIAILGYHIPFPGIGHAAKDGTVNRFVPALWRWGT